MPSLAYLAVTLLLFVALYEALGVRPSFSWRWLLRSTLTAVVVTAFQYIAREWK